MKELIKLELRQWAEKVLSVSNPHFNGHPACPYAEKALAADLVDVRMNFGWGYSEVQETALRFPTRKALVIHAEVNPQVAPHKFHEDIRKLNMRFSKSNIWLLGFHPDDPEPDFDDDIEDFESLVDEPYAMIFVQRLTELDDAARSLEAQRYYMKATTEELSELFRRRQAREEYDDGNGKKTRRTGQRHKTG